MGLLSTAPEGAEVSDIDVSDEAEQPEQQATAPAPEPVKSVPLPPPTGRRAKEAAEKQAYIEKINGFETTLQKRDEHFRQQLAERDERMARMMGNFEAMQRSAQQAPQQQKTDLYAEANALLDKGDFTAYQRKFAEAVRNDVKAELPAPQPQSPGMDPRLQALIMTTPVAGKVMSHEDGPSLAAMFDKQLAKQNYPDGPERWKAAFERAEQVLYSGQPKQAQFPASGRGSLAGVPTGRTNGAAKSSSPQVTPPPGWEAWASRSGMTKDEYLRIYAESHPESVRDE